MHPRSTQPAALAAAALLAAVTLAVAATPARAAGPAPPTCPNAGAVVPPRATAQAIRCLVDVVRIVNGLDALRPDPALRRLARRQARAVVRTGVFAHTVPGAGALAGRLRAARYRGRHASENLFWAAGRRATAAQAVLGWLQSPGHRANLLAPGVRELGIAVVRRTPGGARGFTVAAAFGSG